MSKFTPGPWDYESDIVGGGLEPDSQKITIYAGKTITAIYAGKTLIAIYETNFVECPSGEENKANARLIAAAPEMYEAIKWLCGCMHAAGWEGDPATVNARAILAKIEG